MILCSGAPWRAAVVAKPLRSEWPLKQRRVQPGRLSATLDHPRDASPGDPLAGHRPVAQVAKGRPVDQAGGLHPGAPRPHRTRSPVRSVGDADDRALTLLVGLRPPHRDPQPVAGRGWDNRGPIRKSYRESKTALASSGQDQALRAGAAPSRPGRLHEPVVNRKQRAAGTRCTNCCAPHRLAGLPVPEELMRRGTGAAAASGSAEAGQRELEFGLVRSGGCGRFR
jgi:hypothetical protein